jgi:hypothetical protein
MDHREPPPFPVHPEPCGARNASLADSVPAPNPGTAGVAEVSCRLGINLIPSIADVLFCAIFLFLTFSGNPGLLADGDTGYHIRAGQYILQTLSVPKTDIFSFHTPPLPWTAHEWLSEVVMAAVHDSAGLSGVVAFFAVLLASTIALLFKILRSYGAPTLLAATITLFVCCASQIHWLARPHVFSFLLMIIWHNLLESWERGMVDRLYLLPLSMLLWVNLHGGFLGGFILLGSYLIGNLFHALSRPLEERDLYRKRLRRLLLASGACLLACLCNPRGYHILLFPFKLVSNRFLMDHVSEFLPPNFHDFLPFKYLLLLLVALLAVSRRRVAATELVLILVFTNMALYSARYIPLFALVLAPTLTRQAEQAQKMVSGRLADFFSKRSDNIARLDARATGFLWPAGALIAVAVALGCGRIHHGFDPKIKAVGAVEFLMQEKIAGNMFNDDEFGDYLIYRAYPSYRVFFDGRSDMYGTERLQEYLKITGFEAGWERILDKYRITWIFYGTNSNLSRFLLNKEDWVLIYSDSVASIFVKDLPQYGYLKAQYRLRKLAEVATGNQAAQSSRH